MRDPDTAPPSAPVPSGWRIGLESVEGHQRLTIRLRSATGEVAAAADGVHLDLGAGAGVDLPFASQVVASDSVALLCRADVPDHAVTVRVTPRQDSVFVEVEDTVELPSTLAELSIAFRLLDADEPGESFAPQDHSDPREVAGDASWRTPLAFVRAGTRAMAVLPDVDSRRPRVLPGALELRPVRAASIRHGLVAQRIVASAAGVTCWRDQTLARRVAGQTVAFAQELRLWADAQSHQTLADLVRDLWQRLAMANVDLGREPLAAQVERLLQTRSWAESGDASVRLSVPFERRLNALLVAAALATLDDPRARDAGLALVRLAHNAPQRSGLSPSVAQVGGGRPRWSQGGELASLPGEVYDGTAVAWTRVCDLMATQSLPASHPDRIEAERAALRTATFLLANQRSNGAIPAVYEATYLAPVQSVLYEPAVETGTAALLLAECADFAGENRSKWRQGAVAAIAYLRREIAPERLWFHRSTLLAAGTRPTHATQSLSFAALAALRLLDVADYADARAAATLFLEELALHQQLWSPLWLAADPRRTRLIGGFSQHDADPSWSDPVQALAGLAFLHGYRHLGRRDFAQRGALALRAALAATPAAAPDALSPLGMAAAVCQLAMQRFGSVLVDVGTGFAEPIEVLDVALSPAAVGEIALSARGAEQATRAARAVFFNLPAAPDRYGVSVDGGVRETFTTSEMAAGIGIRPQAVLMPVLAPPTEIQFDRPFTPRLHFETPPPRGWSGSIEVRLAQTPEGPPLASLELVPSDDPLTWRTREPFEPSEPAQGRVLLLFAELMGPEKQLSSVRASNPTTVGAQTVIDIAGPNEIDCTSADVCPRQLFVDGDRLARLAGVGANALVWQLTVPPSALELELEVLLAGPLRLRANDSLVHEDATATVARRLRVTIADRRLWELGRLTLTFEPAGDSRDAMLQVAELRTRVSVDPGTPAERVEPFTTLPPPDRARVPDAQLSVLVVPVALTDAPLTVSQDQLSALFFGNAYRRTAGPDATTGSVREVLAAISGGRTGLIGDVVPPLRAEFPAIDLADPKARSELATVATKALAERGRDYEAIVVVHSGKSPDGGGGIEPLPRVEGVPPIVSLAEHDSDSSVLAVGQALAAILRARYDLQPRSTPASGNFGALTLAGHGSDHRPAAPIGIDLARLGWADIVNVDQTGEIVAAATQRERRVYRVPTQLPGRGDLFLEVRGGLAEEPDLPEAGLLAYWRWSDPPLIRNRRGDIAYPNVLRLPRRVTTVDAPFVPGAATDLVRRVRRLDDLSDPSLMSKDGELCFQIEDLATAIGPEVGERVGFQLRILTQDLMTQEPTAQVMMREPVWTPLPLDGVDRGVGSAATLDKSIAVHAGSHFVRVGWGLPAVDGRGYRLFVRGHVRQGPARMRLRYSDAVAVERLLDVDAGPFALAADLPPASNQVVWCEFAAAGDSDTSLTLDTLLAAPRARADRVPLRGNGPSAAVLSDGFAHVPALPLTTAGNGDAELIEPVLLPAGRAMLRLRCGFAADAKPGTTAKLEVTLTSSDGKRRVVLLEPHSLLRTPGEQPLLTALLDIATGDEPTAGVLHLAIHAVPGVTLWLVNAEIARP